MKQNQFKITLVASCIAATFGSTAVQATHFRGAALVPSVDANGLLTVDAKSFWQPSRPDGTGTISITGVGSVSDIAALRTVDSSDIRRDEVNEVYQVQLPPGGGTYTMNWSSTSWVLDVPNAAGNYGTTSTIFWDGTNANTPIIFDLENIQQEVVRGAAYSDNLDAIGNGITYDDTSLAAGVTSQAIGFSIDASGQINIGAAATGGYLDNPNSNSLGADQAFSAQINAADGSSVQFDWLFDAVGTASNNAPQITDLIVNALIGDTIGETIVATDPDGDPVTVSFNSLFGPGGIAPGNSLFDSSTLGFSWDTTGFAVGSYIATFNASDGSLTDQGTIRINLTTRVGNPNPNPVSAPSGTAVLAIGLLGLLGFGRRKKK